MELESRPQGRVKTCMQAFVSDLTERFDMKVMIRDVSPSGCLLISSRIDELPPIFNLTPEGFGKPMRARLAWRKRNMAGVQVLSESDPEVKSAIEKLLVQAMESDDFGSNDIVLLLTGTKAPPDYMARLKKMRGERSQGDGASFAAGKSMVNPEQTAVTRN